MNHRKDCKLSDGQPEELLTSAEVARIFRMSRETIQQYAREGSLRGCKIGRQWLFRREDVQAFKASHGR